MKWIHLGYRGCLEWNSDRGVVVEVVITLIMKMKMKMRMMLRWMKTKNRQRVIAWVIRHYLMYVVSKSEGQSNHLIIMIINDDDDVDDDDDDDDNDNDNHNHNHNHNHNDNDNDNHNHNHNHNHNNNPLLTLGSIYSTDASAPEKISETNNSNWT